MQKEHVTSAIDIVAVQQDLRNNSIVWLHLQNEYSINRVSQRMPLIIIPASFVAVTSEACFQYARLTSTPKLTHSNLPQNHENDAFPRQFT